jgi:hypothetical protein
MTETVMTDSVCFQAGHNILIDGKKCRIKKVAGSVLTIVELPEWKFWLKAWWGRLVHWLREAWCFVVDGQ